MGERGPLVEEKMRGMGSVVVMIIGVGIRGSRRGGHVDPFLLPLPHRSSEHRGRSVPGRGPPQPGPNSLHLAQISQLPASDLPPLTLTHTHTRFFFYKKKVLFYDNILEFSPSTKPFPFLHIL